MIDPMKPVSATDALIAERKKSEEAAAEAAKKALEKVHCDICDKPVEKVDRCGNAHNHIDQEAAIVQLLIQIRDLMKGALPHGKDHH